mgnify:CR=1 FL=1
MLMSVSRFQARVRAFPLAILFLKVDLSPYYIDGACLAYRRIQKLDLHPQNVGRKADE